MMEFGDEERPVDEPTGPAGEPADEIIELDNATEITVGDLLTDSQVEAIRKTEGTFRRPGFWPSVAWTLLLMVGQVVLGVGVVLVMMVQQALTSRNGFTDHMRMQDDLHRVLLPVASLSTMVFALGLVWLLFGRHADRCVGFRRMTISQAILVLLAALPLSVLTSEFTNCVAQLLPRMPMMEMFGVFAKESFVLIFLGGCVFPGVGEEVFFRGFLSRGLLTRLGVVWGAIATAFLFGAIHIHPIQASGAFLLGLVLQAILLMTRSLWGPILLHTANNTVAFAAMKFGQEWFPIDGFTVESEHGNAHTSPALVLAALLAAGTLLMAMYQTRTQWILPNGTAWGTNDATAEEPLPELDATAVSPTINVRWCLQVLLTYAAFLVVLVNCIGS